MHVVDQTARKHLNVGKIAHKGSPPLQAGAQSGLSATDAWGKSRGR
jgi:hypothetical protein